MLYLLAQAAPVVPPVPDPLAGWGTLLLQGGAFGLLCIVVVYLAPKAMKEAKEERAARDATFQALVELMQTKFEDRNKLMTAAIEKQTVSLMGEMSKQTDILEMALRNVCKAGER